MFTEKNVVIYKENQILFNFYAFCYCYSLRILYTVYCYLLFMEKKMNITPEMIRKKFKSVSELARKLNVTRNAVYRAINGDEYFDKLRKRIHEAMEENDE